MRFITHANQWFLGRVVNCLDWTCVIHSSIFMNYFNLSTNKMAALLLMLLFSMTSQCCNNSRSQYDTMECPWQPKYSSAGAIKFQQFTWQKLDKIVIFNGRNFITFTHSNITQVTQLNSACTIKWKHILWYLTMNHSRLMLFNGLRGCASRAIE